MLRKIICILFLFSICSCKSNNSDLTQQEVETVVIDSLIETKKLLFDTTQWSEVLEGPLVKLDIRYADTTNFTGKIIYACGKCFLRPHVSKTLRVVQSYLLQNYNYGIILYDCHRPRPAQRKLWEIVPDERFVSNPDKGSMHNRGMAIDVGLVDLKGEILDMGSDFDHFGQKSFHSATNIPVEAIKRRKILKETMERFGFMSITSEWWHYSYRSEIAPLSDWEWPCN